MVTPRDVGEEGGGRVQRTYGYKMAAPNTAVSLMKVNTHMFTDSFSF